MRSFFRILSDERAEDTRGRVSRIYAVLLVFNLVAWGSAVIAFHHFPLLLGTAFLAYSLGLRHAVDADHIAAIDNVTRKFLQQGKRSVLIGMMFSLGHSTIVLVGSLLIAISAAALQHRVDPFKEVGVTAGTLLSAAFLFGIATVNLLDLKRLYRAFLRVRKGKAYVEEHFEAPLRARGFLATIFRPVFGMIETSWHMYPLGILFGLGFDTATEIGVLGISAAQAAKGLPLWSIVIFPILFAAGMSLVDTTDNILMLGAYGWAFVKPVRRIYYNLTMTCISVLVAFAVGGIETLGLLANRFELVDPPWNLVTRLNNDFGLLGYCIIGMFGICWSVSIALYKWHRLDYPEYSSF